MIPEFMYGALYDEKHRFHVISTDIEKSNKFKQKGITEPLLCSECEGALSKHERYVSLVFSGQLHVSARREGRIVYLEGLEYESFKLFALSVLWRAGVSSLQMFEEVQLGPHQEKLRRMVHSGNPGETYEYPFLLSPIRHKGELQQSMIVQPTTSRIDGHLAYRFVFGGLVWVFVVTGHRVPAIIENASISKKGRATMLEWELSDMRFITNMAQELVVKGKV